MAGGQKGYEIPAGAGRAAYVVDSPTALVEAGYTAVSPEALRKAFGPDGDKQFLVALGYQQTQSA